MRSKYRKVLLIRFSSFGDITQALSIPSKLADFASELHWVTRSDFTPLLHGHPHIHKIWSLSRKKGWKSIIELFRLALHLRQEKFTHIYDAHNNLRSYILSWLLIKFFNPPIFLRKSQKRWLRFLLFTWRINLYRQPFSGQRDLLEPLKTWGLNERLPPVPQLFISQSVKEHIDAKLTNKLKGKNYLTLAPSAAHPLKRWPLAYWQELIDLLPQWQFVVLGGSEDSFLQELEKHNPVRILNFAGQTDFVQSAAVIEQSLLLISNDTGVLHVAEQLGKKCIALMGPAPFGFPSRPSTTVMQLNLECRPCSKHGQGPCVNSKFHRCLVDILPLEVAKQTLRLLMENP